MYNSVLGVFSDKFFDVETEKRSHDHVILYFLIFTQMIPAKGIPALAIHFLRVRVIIVYQIPNPDTRYCGYVTHSRIPVDC